MGGFQLVDMLPQTGGGNPILFRVFLWKNEIVPSAALHGHAEIEKPTAGAERVEFPGKQQRVPYLNEAPLLAIHIG